MKTSRAQIAVLLAVISLAGGCNARGGSGGGEAVAVPRVHLGSQTGDTTATATYPNSCEIDLDFGNVPIGLIDTVTVQIENIGNDVLDLSQVTPPLDPEFGLNDSLEPPIWPGGFDELSVTFQPYKVGQVTSTFTIQTSGVNGQCPAPTGTGTDNVITVTLTGNGVQLSLVVQPNVLDFGDTFIGTIAKKSVMLINKSAAPVTGITATVVGGDSNLFAVDDAPATLGAGDSATVDISYSPLALETRSLASVEFAGSDGEKTTLNLFGEPVGVALTLAPNQIDFGFVPVGTTVVGCTTVSNQSSAPVEITGTSSFDSEGEVFAMATADDATPPNPYTFPTMAAPLVIDGGASAKVCFQLTPPLTQQYEGEVTLTTNDPSGTNPVVQLTGWGGGPQISCTPPSIAFGPTVAYTPATIPVMCTNVGSGIPATGLLIDPPKSSAAVFSAQIDTTKAVPPNGLAPGQSAQVDVSYVPTATASDEGTLTITSNGGRGQPIQIALAGQGLDVPPCQFAISPTAIDFGNVPPGQTSVTIPFEVRNVGTDRCVVQNLAFLGDGGTSFYVASATPDRDPALGNAIVLPAPSGGVPSGVTFMIAFEPPDGGASGDTSVEGVVGVANPASTGNVVSLTATSEAGCLEVPRERSGGTSVFPQDAGMACTGAARSFSILNHCSTDATIQSFSFQLGPWDVVPQFSIGGPPLPLELGAGATAIYEVTFEPTTEGVHTGEILISDGTLDSVFPASGTTVPPPDGGCQ